jgi:VWFA-related protein
VSWGLAASLAIVTVASALSSGAAQQPTFRAAVDVVLVDVHVVDAGGSPVAGLEPADFDVRLNGRRRPVLSVDFVRAAIDRDVTTVRRPSATGPVARNIWPTPDGAPVRAFVIAIDANSLEAGDGAGVVRAASTFLDQLPAQDLVGVVTLPRGPSQPPTTDRTSTRRVLSMVSGLRAMRPNPFHLTPSEAADIASEMDRASLSRMAGGRGASLFTPMVLRQVQARECPGSADQACAQGIVIEADAQIRQIEDDVAESLAGLRMLLTLLADLPGRKTVVLLSGGLPVSDRSGGWHSDGSEVRSLGRATAAANATVYAVHVDRGFRDGQTPEARVMRPGVAMARDRELQQRLLASFAVTGGGTLIEASTDAGEAALDRILLETSARYTIGVAPDPSDLDGRIHELRVRLTDSGGRVRSPRYVLLRPRP